MSRKFDNAAKQTRAFAEQLMTLLNRTVCDAARIGVFATSDSRASLATGMTKGGRPTPVPLRATGDVPVWLRLSCRTFVDQDGYLTVESSAFTVSAVSPESELFHYDYERDKDNYPDAHLQVRASSPVWDALLVASGKNSGSLHKLHLPVGGRRYRPSLEDILEALICEGIRAPHGDDWQKTIDQGRERFRARQLAAAVRRQPEIAAQALRDAGYTVSRNEGITGRVIALADRARAKKN